MKNDGQIKVESEDLSPPFFKSWNMLYGFVLFTLAFLVILFYLFTKAFE